MDLLLTNAYILYTATLLLGLVVGSFLNVVIYRLPRILEYNWRCECSRMFEQNGHDLEPETQPPGLAKPRSRCPHCGHTLRPWENIPVLSFLLLRGKCSACGATISLRYPIVETVSGLLALAAVWQFGPSLQGATALLLSWTLLTLALIDFDTQLLPDVITLPMLWLGLLLSLESLFTDPASAIIGATTGYLSLWSVYQLFKLLTGKEGMGYGDFKLLALLGAWLGWQHLPQIVILSTLVGAVVGVLLMVFHRHGRDVPIPFGPYLAAAGWISLMWGDTINRFYLLWSGLA
jgi:leader peptidase (prepilin peptidase)/N-methyltransferase